MRVVAVLRSGAGPLVIGGALAAVLATMISATPIAGSEVVVRRAPATVGAARTHGTPDARRASSAERLPSTITQPRELERKLPTAASAWGPPPQVASRARSTTTLVAPRTKSQPASPASYRGRNHVWIPSLGISRSVQSFPCSRARPPGAGLYRWGCAGRNNVYLMSHAWNTFKPLHDAYVGGRLQEGMKVWYADGAGRTRQFRVVWWRVTAPTTAASWAWAAQGRSSMTLQTCVGAHSERRLIVRLVQVG
jgi:hypothetical protein